MANPENSPPPARRPYADAAPTYWANGWRGILPIPASSKKIRVTGWTGNDGAWPSYPDVQAWSDGPEGDGNIALRLPPNVLGIDVDHYDGKPGGAVLAQLEQQHGQLPATWRTTSRDDGVSGIRLYRIPESLRWPGILGPGIETVRTGHRYAMTWPSVHPGGATYRWITPAGTTAIGQVPTIDELPHLPDAWVHALTRGEQATDQHRAGLTTAAANTWLAARTGADTAPCSRIDHALDQGLARLHTAESRHDAALTLTNRLIWLAGEGHHGIRAALDTTQAAFLQAVAGDRDPHEAQAEWDRMIDGAIDLAAAAFPDPEPVDPCDNPFSGLIDRRSQPCPTTSNETSPASPTPSSNSPSPSPQPPTNETAPTPDPETARHLTGPEPVVASPASYDDSALDPDELHRFYLQELARITGREAAQRHYDTTHETAVVEARVRRKLFDDKATKAYRDATEPPAPEFDMGTLAEVLARPDEPPMRVDQLVPWSSSTLIVAQRKSGKTTLLLNYADALLTGREFLGTFPVIPLDPGQRVAMLNYEVNGKMIARWANDVGIDPDRLILINLRGRRNPLGHDEDRERLVQALVDANVGAILVDPFGRAYTGDSQNDNAEVQRFLISLDQFAREEVGALDLVLAAHAGWDGERTRGASALEDWPDTIINITKNSDDEEHKSYFRAIGRDVEIEEDALVMDPVTRHLKLAGTGPRRKTGKKTAGRARSLAVLVTSAVNRTHEALSKNQLGKAIRALPLTEREGLEQFGEQLLSDAIELAYAGDFIVTHPGAGPRGSLIVHRRDLLRCDHCSQNATAPSSPGAVTDPHRP
ncbi:AAA family ATPase, partial [Flexivirga sp.]|uniref:AAA family ATPase n=1 Tax=Flexivirga sp. TaxID=1962927 RepID=UPI003F7F93E8